MFVMLEHRLSHGTLELLEQTIEVMHGRLVIYARHNWAVEDAEGQRLIAFDPYEDSEYLRGELRRGLSQA